MTRAQMELFHGLSDQDAAGAVALGATVKLSTGEVLFRLGGDADRLFIIERGRVALSLPMRIREREENVLIEERGVGQALGWSALTPPHRFTLTATAQVETDVLAIPRDALLDHFRSNPAVGHVIALNVAQIIGQRLEVFQAMWLREMQRVVSLSYA